MNVDNLSLFIPGTWEDLDCSILHRPLTSCGDHIRPKTKDRIAISIFCPSVGAQSFAVLPAVRVVPHYIFCCIVSNRVCQFVKQGGVQHLCLIHSSPGGIIEPC